MALNHADFAQAACLNTHCAEAAVYKHSAFSQYPFDTQNASLPGAEPLVHAGLYQAGPRNRYFDLKAVVGWLANSAFQSAVVFVMVMGALAPQRADRHAGRTAGQWQTGATLFTAVVITVHLEISSVIDHWTWLHAVSIIFSVCKLPSCLLCYRRLCCATLCCAAHHPHCCHPCITCEGLALLSQAKATVVCACQVYSQLYHTHDASVMSSHKIQQPAKLRSIHLRRQLLCVLSEV